MIFRRGDVVMVDHPFSDGRGSKVRPMLIVQSDARNQRLNHSVVAMMTTNLSFIGSDPTQVLVDINAPDGAGSGLSASSAIRCGNLFTLHEKFILHKIGALSAALMRQVDDGLRVALELP
jgi:mRNA interferase MazF